MARTSLVVLTLASLLVLTTGCDSLFDSNRPPTGSVPLPSFSVGDTGPAGGIVIYVDVGNDHPWNFLEAWTADEGVFRWQLTEPFELMGGTGTAIGTGAANTALLAGAEHPAAQAARNASHGGFTDWFLPSKDELVMVRANRAALGAATDDVYWSSSEHNATQAHSHIFQNPTGGISGKANEWRVRVIRSFE